MKKIRLSIAKETLRVLKVAEIAKIFGGTATDTCPATDTCILPPETSAC